MKRFTSISRTMRQATISVLSFNHRLDQFLGERRQPVLSSDWISLLLHRLVGRLFGIVSITTVFLATASAATYYVDYEGGSDTASGTSPATAWKHSPGDSQAEARPKAVTLDPGDTVIFKGGVSYHGSIVIKASGSAERPIVFDGNSAGTFGEGRAILDGARVIEGWRAAQSPDEVEGNPRWREIFYADLDLDISSNFNHGKVITHRQAPSDVQAPWQRMILIDGNRQLLPIAQLPKPTDPFYPDLPADFFESPKPLTKDASGKLSIITDRKNLTARRADAYDGVFLGVHGGNNHVYFAAVQQFDPKKGELSFAEFKHRAYPTTRYALYNAPQFISEPGEWAVKPIGNGKSRVYFLPDRRPGRQSANVGYPIHQTGFTIADGASNIVINQFLIQRFSGDQGGISVARASKRSSGITITNNEIRFVSGHAGIGLNFCDNIVLEKNYIHQCPSWTSGIFLSRVNDYRVENCRLEKNSGSGIRHYECKRGVLANNAVLDHYGMHSSGINIYEGCENLVLESNYIQNVVAMNRNAQNIVIRNNVIDAQNKTPVTFPMWNTGQAGGRNISNIQFINNTFVNTDPGANWSAGIFVQAGGSTPTKVVIRNNVIDRISGKMDGTFENNIFLRPSPESYMNGGSRVVDNLRTLFMDPEQGDFRRRPGGPLMEAGSDIPPPPPEMEWH